MKSGADNRGFARTLSLALGAVLVMAMGAHAQTPTNGKDPDRRCMQCHGQPHIAELSPAERRSMVGTWLDTGAPPPGAVTPPAPLKGDEPSLRPGLFVQPAPLAASPHAALSCVECHQDAERLPHAATLNRATCATSCHTKVSDAYLRSAHEKARRAGDATAPTCVSCHGGHEILRISDRRAAQHRLSSLFLCGDCHKKHGPSENIADSASWVGSYLNSTHAKAVTNSGLLHAATCSDCHGAHGVLPSRDPESSVNHAKIPATCGQCHAGIVETYSSSIHGKQLADKNTKAAVCTDCHSSHGIARTAGTRFLADVIDECGRCHDSPDRNGDRVGTYYQTYHRSYHGQVTRLGASRAARCSDCHGSHDIRALSDPLSRVSKRNLIATCGQAGCHPGANAQFVKFDPHANHRDGKNYPVLHGVWLYFMIMMSAVFTFFGLHTLLWFIRSMIDRARHGRPPTHARAATVIRRFTTINRVNHALVAITFFGLTATGIPLVFSQQAWARTLAGMFGGVEAAGIWHRFFAILLIINFVIHFAALGQAFMKRSGPWHRWLFGPNSLVPRWKDAADCAGMFRWFFGLGKRPSFDRWTYWEKFDYWAEVGGSVIIGGSGFLLWFPEAASKVLPGWAFNIAMIVHGYEALLAIGFIFTIHFFNAHIRPGTFPVDEVIFTGTLPEHELKEQRPEEYKRLVDSGRLESIRIPAPTRSRRWLWVLIAIVSVGIGTALLALIILGGLRA